MFSKLIKVYKKMFTKLKLEVLNVKVYISFIKAFK